MDLISQHKLVCGFGSFSVWLSELTEYYCSQDQPRPCHQKIVSDLAVEHFGSIIGDLAGRGKFRRLE
jgi:hypothetical protein